MLQTQDPVAAKERLTSWWRGEDVEGVAWRIVARRDIPSFDPPPIPEAKDWMDHWTNPRIRVARFEHELAHTAYLGDAIPYLDSQIGPGSFGLFIGVEPVFAPTTVWYEPTLDDLGDGPDLHFDPQNKWYRVHVDYIEAALEASKGRYYVSLPDLVEGLDTLAAIYNNQKLLVDLMDRPQVVHAYLERLTELYFEAFDPLYEMVRDEGGGCCFSAFQTWAPGRYAKVQCDIAAALGPRQFGEFVAPYLAKQCEGLDYAMFHLDGPDCICHLDHLLEVPGLQVIQWTPGAGQPGVHDPMWFDMYHKILERKSLILIGVPLDQAKSVVDAIGTRGVYMVTMGCGVEEGKRALEASKGW
ncbi:MAG: hypothetical protein GF320_10950 [Armatimonadia bacterium]|nr:hypothetical protein [Armatimonadia bacterium]